MIDLSIDRASLSAIKKLEKVEIFLATELSSGIQKLGSSVQQSAVSNTWSAFMNPTGELANSLLLTSNGPLSLSLGSDLPYERRLELGFSGTDSMGRTYDEKAEPYLSPAVDSNIDTAEKDMENSVLAAFLKMGIGI